MPDDMLLHAEPPDDPSVEVGARPASSGAVPADLIDLTRWYLTLPRNAHGGSGGKPQNVYQEDGREGGLLGFSHPTYFRVRDGAVEYVAPVDGATTSSESGSTRCELREMSGPRKTDKPDWTLGAGSRSLTCTLTCDPTSIRGECAGTFRARNECIVGQIHSGSHRPPLHLAVRMKDSGSGVLQLFLAGGDTRTLLTGLGPRTRFTYRIEVDDEDDECRVWAAVGDDWQAGRDPATIPASGFPSREKCYFKAGAYNKTKIQEEGRRTNTGASVVRHFRLRIG